MPINDPLLYVTEVVLIPFEQLTKTIVFDNNDLRLLENVEHWWMGYDDNIVKGYTLLVRVADPKMHAHNLTGDYQFKFDPENSDFHLTSPVELTILYSAHLKALISAIQMIFDLDL